MEPAAGAPGSGAAAGRLPPGSASALSAPRAPGMRGGAGAQVKARALQELEFDGRLGRAAGKGGGDKEKEFENGIVHSMAGIVEGLKSGSDAQRSLILFEVQQLVRHSHSVEYALRTLVPVICEEVTGWSPELQICAAESLIGLQAAKLPHDHAVQFMETAFEVLRENQDPHMFRAWGEILVGVLPHVTWTNEELERILENLDRQQNAADSATKTAAAASGRDAAADPGAARAGGGGDGGGDGVSGGGGDGEQVNPSRGKSNTQLPLTMGRTGASCRSLDECSASELSQKLTARIIGPIAVSASPELVRNVLLTRALELTKEHDLEIRGMVVESMAFIGAAVDVDTVQTKMWPSLLALVRDPNARLHAATLRTIARIAAAHRKASPTAPLFTKLLPPVFARECQYLRKQAQADQRLLDEDTYLLIEINAEIFGEVLFSCQHNMADEAARKDALRAYQAMATCNGPVVRRQCAFNIPGVGLALAWKCRSEIATIVEALSRDSDAETRWNLAAGMHETAKMLIGDDTMDNLFKTVNALLHDQSPLVRMNVLRNLDNLLGTLTNHNPYKAMKKLETVFQNLQLLSEGNWRTQELLAKQLRLVASLVPPQCIRANVLPLLYQLSEESSYTVRKASMAAVAVCMRYIPDTTERDSVMENFRLEWGRGSIFWMRIGFIDSAEAAVETYSRILFRDTFAAEVLRLAHDTVPNVRIRASMLMDKIAPACHQMDEYHAAVETLQGDADKDVLCALEGIEEKISNALAKAKRTFEQDMSREAEEQSLYTKHLQLKAEVKKKSAGVRNNTRALLDALSPRGGAATSAAQSPFGSNSAAPGNPATETAPSDSGFVKRKVPRAGSSIGSRSFIRGGTKSAKAAAAQVAADNAGLGGDSALGPRKKSKQSGRTSQPLVPVGKPVAHDELHRRSKSQEALGEAMLTSPVSVQGGTDHSKSSPNGKFGQVERLDRLDRLSSEEERPAPRSLRNMKALMVKMSPRAGKVSMSPRPSKRGAGAESSPFHS